MNIYYLLKVENSDTEVLEETHWKENKSNAVHLQKRKSRKNEADTFTERETALIECNEKGQERKKKAISSSHTKHRTKML